MGEIITMVRIDGLRFFLIGVALIHRINIELNDFQQFQIALHNPA